LSRLLQVEDMLKRSFLEFHAQKAAPEAVKALARGQAALAALRSAPWPLPGDGGVSREDVGQYVAVSAQIDALTRKLQVQPRSHHLRGRMDT
jgi:antiviral helicase SKI2